MNAPFHRDMTKIEKKIKELSKYFLLEHVFTHSCQKYTWDNDGKTGTIIPGG